MENKTETKNKIAKQAGWLYMAMLLGALGLVVAPSQIFDAENPTITFQNLISKVLWLRVGIMANVICQFAFLFLALKLFVLFEKTDRFLSHSLLLVVVASIPVAFDHILFQVDLLELAKTGFVSNNELQVQVQMRFVQFNNQVIFIGLFWGLWLIPFGLLVLKSGYMPKIIGWLLVAGGIAYMLDACAFVLLPEFSNFTSLINSIIPTIAELSAIFWLLAKGIKIDDL